MHGVEQSEALRDPGRQVGRVGLEREGSANVDRPQVHRRVSIHNPVGQGPAGATCRLDADGVEAGGDETTINFGGLAQVVNTIGRKGLWSIEEKLNTGVG